MRKNMPYMVLDITKKPGDPNAVKTGDMLLAENTKLREALEALSAWAKVVKNNPKDTTAIECAEFVEEAIRVALAAPSRNCDKFDTKDKARERKGA